MAEERLQKILARVGYGSRRANEELIIAGRVKVNGEIATLGSKANIESDEIIVDGSTIPKPEKLVYIAINKPRGVLSDQAVSDPRKNVRDLIDIRGHLFNVGRLDMDSEGLMILTNDGELTNKLTHPRYGHDKEYMVLVASRPDDEQLATWRRGVVLEDGFRTAATRVTVSRFHGKGAWLNVIMSEGHKRQIREIGRAIGLPIVKLIRVRIATVNLGNLKTGEWRYLTEDEIKELKDFAYSKGSAEKNRNSKRKYKASPSTNNQKKPFDIRKKRKS